MMSGFFKWLRINQDLGVLLLRLFIGFRLMYGVLDNIFYWQKMLEFRDFLQQFNFPVPLASAVISVYAQFIAAVLVILGFKIRYAALVLIVNFTLAWLMVDRHGSGKGWTAELTGWLNTPSVDIMFRMPGQVRWIPDKNTSMAIITNAGTGRDGSLTSVYTNFYYELIDEVLKQFHEFSTQLWVCYGEVKDFLRSTLPKGLE